MSQTTSPRRRGAYKASVTLLALAAVCLLAVGAKAWLSARPSTAPAVRPAQEDAPNGEESEVENVALLPSGFEPTEIMRPHGKFLLMVSNRTGLAEVEWHLGREAGETLQEVRMPEGSLRSKQYEDLPPGTYVLTEATHPDWVCRITITPN